MNGSLHTFSLPLLLCGLLFVVPLRSDAQNLVFNHSFELYDTCAVVNNVYYPDTGPLGWFSAAGTPDHMISCLPNGSFNSVPLNAWSFQYPQHGDSYGHVTSYRAIPPDIREYFMVHLTEPLVIGQHYHASFYASVAWGGYPAYPQLWVYTSGIGMTFATQPRQWHLNDPYPTPWNFAQVYSAELITDTVGWTRVSGSFVADSAYQYVILGNSFDNANTDTMHIAPQPWVAQGGILIDNVCVSADPAGCDMAVGMVPDREGGWSVFPNPAQGSVVIKGIARGTGIGAFDLQGRTVWEGMVTGERMFLEVDTWPRGTYILRWVETGREGWFKLVLTE
jgi:hypothetical protein